MRRAVAGAAIAAVVFAGLQGAASGAGAASVAATGWWSRNPAASAPAGGMAVGVVPDGPATVAAVKVELGDGVATATLELAEAGGTAPDVASVLACETSTTWEPVEKGPIEASPATTCAEGRSVPLTRDAGSLLWSADVSALLAGRTGLASIALVPIPSSDGVGSLAFEVQWSGPPTLTTTEAPSSATTSVPRPAASGGGGSVKPPAAATQSAPVAKPAAVTAPTLRLPALALPAAAAPSAQASTTTTAATVPQLASQSSGPVAPSDGEGPPLVQALFFILVAAIAGTVAGVGRWFVTSR